LFYNKWLRIFFIIPQHVYYLCIKYDGTVVELYGPQVSKNWSEDYNSTLLTFLALLSGAVEASRRLARTYPVVARVFRTSDTTGYWFVGKPHPGGMPEARAMSFWHPSGMHSFFIHNRWCRSQSLAQPPAKFWQASGLLRR
jgi:hypothetical protein